MANFRQIWPHCPRQTLQAGQVCISRPDIRNIPPIMEEEVTNFFRSGSGNGEDLADLYERIPEPVLIETSQADEFFYNSFKSSTKSKHRSLSLPPIRGNFVLINRMMNCTPLYKKRFEHCQTKWCWLSGQRVRPEFTLRVRMPFH